MSQPEVSHPQKAIRNVGGCFSDHFLFEVLRGRRIEDLAPPEGARNARASLPKIWQDAERRLHADSPLKHVHYYWYRPLLNILGWEPVPAPRAFLEDGTPIPCTLALAKENKTLALLDFQPFSLDPDRDPHPGRDEPVDMGIERSLEATGLRWAILLAGPLLRLYRAGMGITRTFLEVNTPALCENDDPAEWEVFWNLFRHEAFVSGFLDRIGEESHLFASRVGDDLRACASRALVSLVEGFLAHPDNRKIPGTSAQALFEEGMFLLYRMLFILVAESRDLLPLSNPLYREAYSLHHLRDLVEAESPESRGTYFWESLKSLFSLIGGGARSTALTLPPYDGRLFSPERTPRFNGAILFDPAVREAILALSLAPPLGKEKEGRERVSFEALGIPQLGSIYEGLLALEPRLDGEDGGKREWRFSLRQSGVGRKTTGAFYTPEAFTATLVRKTLTPLVAGKSSEEILQLKILDPAMGSGAFLLQAARFLGEAYGRALCREGRRLENAEEDGLAQAKRLVAENCLYGVDLLPLAVELAKVSLWLDTAASGKPLTFLDHRFRVGNSLIGARLTPGPDGFAEIDSVSGPPLPKDLTRLNRREQKDLLAGQLSLFTSVSVRPVLERFAQSRRILDRPEETVEDVRRKEDLYRSLLHADSETGRLKRICDLWCALWFSDGKAFPFITTLPFREVCEEIRRGERSDWETSVIHSGLFERERFFHWELEFPEVFAGERKGFDAILGNPPWEVLKPNPTEFFGPGERGDPEREEVFQREEERVRRWSLFFRHSGKFDHQGRGDLNSYKLFLELIHRLLAKGGRFGVILPSGFYTDKGCAPLRRLFFQETQVEGLLGFENRRKIFPIDERYKFALLFGRKGATTTAFHAAFMLHDPASLQTAPRETIRVDLDFTRTFSGDYLALPECRSPEEWKLLEKIFSGGTALDSPTSTPLTDLKTEFHMRNDRRHIAPWREDGVRRTFVREIDPSENVHVPLSEAKRREKLVPFIQGRCIHQYRGDYAPPRFGVPLSVARERTARVLTPYKIVHRRIARNTDERTLITALIPSRLPCEMNATVIDVTPPTGEPAEPHQLILLGLLNTFVLDFVIRKKVTTTLNMFFLRSLPVPRLSRGDPSFEGIAARAARLTCISRPYAALWESAYKGTWRRLGPGFGRLTRKWKAAHAARDFLCDGRRDGEERARLRAQIDALAAGLFGLNRRELAFLLDTFEVACRNEEKALGEFRSKRLILEAFDEYEQILRINP
ncbi:MAG: Eco57I restriction-modification methylase domain-containing protein [Planctomycetota bacterium]